MIMISAVWMFGHSSLQAASVDHEPVVPEAIGFGLLYDDMRDTIYVRTDGTLMLLQQYLSGTDLNTGTKRSLMGPKV